MKPSKIDLSKTIGLVRYLDGSFRPSNQASRDKLDNLFNKGPYLGAPSKIEKHEMPALRAMAKEHGYKILTSLRALLVFLALLSSLTGCTGLNRILFGGKTGNPSEPFFVVGAGQSNMMMIDLSKDFSSTLQNKGYTNFHTLNAAIGATSLSQWEKGQPIYDALIQKTKAAKRDNERIVLLFWQGENEGRPGNAFEAPNWGLRFSQFIDDVRRDLGQPQMTVVFVQLGKGQPEGWPTWDFIKSEQAHIAKENVVMIKSDDLAQLDDHVHFPPEGYSIMGARLAETLADKFVSENVTH